MLDSNLLNHCAEFEQNRMNSNMRELRERFLTTRNDKWTNKKKMAIFHKELHPNPMIGGKGERSILKLCR